MIKGSCFCGEIEYAVSDRLLPACACHCSRCRKAFSAAASAYAPLADPDSFSWLRGENLLSNYVGKHGWGLAFCSVCGATLVGVLNGRVHGVALGSVDGDPGVPIAVHVFVGSKAPWDHIGGDAPQYEEHLPDAEAPN